MIECELEIINKLGMHARAAAKFVTLASRFKADIQISLNDSKVNGKSIMGVMMLAAAQGSQVCLHIEGPDEVDAAEQLASLIKNRFDEAS
ncbi:MAG: HPr family phosphocarrier protein [Proteobacteria bacterium]|jgi:phosphocarrier protein HPr|nr:HPr family phosphocarrier protein [Pseudomonadota bacterium]MCG6936256.1 HPr family phosphocarrier protein [Pseudomonadota bacterium]